jgi:hypothetical protein
MLIEEYLLFALAVIYFMISSENPGREHRAARQNDQDSRSSIDAGLLKRGTARREQLERNF